MLSPSLENPVSDAFAILQNGDSAKEVGDALEIPTGQLLYLLYKQLDTKKYTAFAVPKRSGGEREIFAPSKGICILQHKLLTILEAYYVPPEWVHGFVSGKSIVSNAEAHRKKRIVVNLDLENFYDSINFGRVRGSLQNRPFKFHAKVATVLAQLVTFQNRLPQGAPTSPLISNLVAWGLDIAIVRLAKKHHLKFTRYADDITLSTTKNAIDKEIVSWDGPNPLNGEPKIGKDLRSAIEKNGFSINEGKFRIQLPSIRQEVTGLTVSEFPNVKRSFVRRIRALIHSWQENGLIEAERIHVSEHATNPPDIPLADLDGTYFKQVVYGHMAHLKSVRTDENATYLRFCERLAMLDDKPPAFIQLGKEKFEVFDFFICHASEDKEDVARPLEQALTVAGKSTFLDEKYIKWGDSFVEKVNNALAKSKFVIAVISVNSVNKHWPRKEVHSVLASEEAKGKRLLPLMVGSKKQIENLRAELPLLDDRLFLEWSDGIVAVVEAALEVIDL